MKTLQVMMLTLLLTTTVVFGLTPAAEYEKWYQQGIVKVKQGDLESAKQSFFMALAYKPGDANATKGLEMAEARLNRQPVPQPKPVAESVLEKKHAASKGGIRIGIRNHPGVSEEEFDYYETVHIYDYYTRPLDEQVGWQVDLMYVKRFLGRDGRNKYGAKAGAGVFIANASGEDSSGEVELSILGLIGEGAFVIRPTESIVIEVGGSFGLGQADVTETVPDGFSGSPGDGVYVSFSAKAGVFYLIGERMELGLEVGYMTFGCESEVDYMGSTADLTYSGDGVQGGATFTWKF